MNNSSFNLRNLKATHNKKVDINLIYEKIHRKFSLQESTQYAFVGYYKSKKHVVLVVFSNEKVFIDDEKDKVPYIGVYTYKEILKLDYIENSKHDFKSCLELRTSSEVIRIKGISRETFQEIVKTFNEQKDKYMKFFPEKIISNIRDTSYMNHRNNLYDEYDSTDDKDKNILNKDDLVNNDLEKEFINEEKMFNTHIDKKLLNENNFFDKNKEIPTEIKQENKSKKVVNDGLISKTNTYSSAYLSSLFLADDQSLPSGQKTLFYDFSKKISFLENASFSLNSIDTISLRLDKKALKLNTIPIIAELEPLTQQHQKEQYETRFLFTRNWIEYTKHNVTDKVLGVDSNGNGAYLDLSRITSTHIIDTFKAKEYKINDEIRTGLRSSQTISIYEKNGRPGIDSLYYNKNTKKRLDVKKYDGIIFLGIKYYFNVFHEFSKLQREYTRVFFEDKKPSGEVYRKYELIFEDDLISYKAYNERGVLVDDLYPNAASFDLKWLTFFKD